MTNDDTSTTQIKKDFAIILDYFAAIFDDFAVISDDFAVIFDDSANTSIIYRD